MFGRLLKLTFGLLLCALLAGSIGCNSSAIPESASDRSDENLRSEPKVIIKTITITRVARENRGEIRYVAYFLYSDELPDTVLVGAPARSNNDIDLLPLLKAGDRVTVQYWPGGGLVSVKFAAPAGN